MTLELKTEERQRMDEIDRLEILFFSLFPEKNYDLGFKIYGIWCRGIKEFGAVGFQKVDSLLHRGLVRSLDIAELQREKSTTKIIGIAGSA